MAPTSLWIVWTIIGIIGGYMVARLIPRNPGTPLSVTIGICGALAGGWLTIVSFGSVDKIEILSLVVAAAFCALFLWIMTLISPRRNDDE